MKRILVAVAVAATPVLAAPAQACEFRQCAGAKQVCELGVVTCGSGVLPTLCNTVHLPPPVCR